MKIEPFKMKVTPLQFEIVVKACIDLGARSFVQDNYNFIFVGMDGYIGGSNDPDFFADVVFREVQYAEFMELYENNELDQVTARELYTPTVAEVFGYTPKPIEFTQTTVEEFEALCQVSKSFRVGDSVEYGGVEGDVIKIMGTGGLKVKTSDGTISIPRSVLSMVKKLPKADSAKLDSRGTTLDFFDPMG